MQSNTIVYACAADISRMHSLSEPVIGYAYEWEGERVVHLRMERASHAFGRESRCLFLPVTPQFDEATEYRFLEGEPGIDSAEWFLRISEGTPEAFCTASNECVAPLLIPAETDLYSRSKGLLEVGVLRERTVLVIGLGSFGSEIADGLARAGVGRFLLADYDRVEPHNLARHTASLQDLGRLKTEVVKDKILGKNPYAHVETFVADICQEPKLASELIGRADLVICATDNNQSRFLLQQLLIEQQKPCIFGRAITRAEGGDVFRYRPGGPCYSCLLSMPAYRVEEEIRDVRSARQSGQIAEYTSPEEADAMVQVGLSADIAPITNMMIRLSLVELSRGTASGIECLEEELPFDYYMWANRRERRHQNWSPFPTAGPMPTILRWYGVRIERKDECAQCGELIELEID